MEVLTGEQMRRVDRRAIESLGIPSLDLMEAAGSGVASALLEDEPGARTRSVLVLCGKGNNGGDGLVAARHLARMGVVPRVLVLAREEQLKPDARVNLDRLRGEGVPFEEIPEEADWSRVASVLEGKPLVLDALLGTGVHGGAHGIVATVVDAVNRTRAPVVSIDLPSGLDSDTHLVRGPAVRARRTYTLCRPKLALVQDPAATYTDSFRVVPIGIPDECVAAELATIEWIDAEAAGRLLPSRPADSHKGTYGHLLVIAGSRGKSGAAVLVARAALRAGVGLVTVGAPASVQTAIAVQQAEVMTEALPERAGALARRAALRVLKHLASRQALAIGPGLGTSSETRAAVQAILRGRPCPAVLDADGLNAHAGGRLLSKLRGKAPLVITPHPGEAGRLLGADTAAVQGDRIGAARDLAREAEAVAVLKGRRTVVATPDGRASVVSTGNPGMATGGTGDALTGVVGAFLARGLAAFDAARLAAYLHGDAGDRAASARGTDGMIAQDLIDELPGAIRRIRDGWGRPEW
jgi:ADP-dependent NAD(P)H-hydrate dehydratase / NAD(P)H-hydrate epimerase